MTGKENLKRRGQSLVKKGYNRLHVEGQHRGKMWKNKLGKLASLKLEDLDSMWFHYQRQSAPPSLFSSGTKINNWAPVGLGLRAICWRLMPQWVIVQKGNFSSCSCKGNADIQSGVVTMKLMETDYPQRKRIEGRLIMKVSVQKWLREKICISVNTY